MVRNWRRCAARLSGHKKRNTELTHCINRCFRCGGEEGIRTLDTLMRYTRFPIVRARPTTRLLRVCRKKRIFSFVQSQYIIEQKPWKVKREFSGFFERGERRTTAGERGRESTAQMAEPCCSRYISPTMSWAQRTKRRMTLSFCWRSLAAMPSFRNAGGSSGRAFTEL